MRRRLYNLATTVSLVLCVATVALWVRNFFMSDSISVAWPNGNLIAVQLDQGIVVTVVRDWPARRPLAWSRRPINSRATWEMGRFPAKIQHDSFLGIHVFRGVGWWTSSSDRSLLLVRQPPALKNIREL